MKANGIVGPIFITIGESDQLQMFLEKNPKIPKELIFVDQPTLESYNAMGLGKMFENKELTKKGGKNFKAPNLTFNEWKNYLTSVGKVMPAGSNEDVLLKVSKLGATYAINKKNIVYVYEEGVPGDNPDIKEVLAIIKNSK